MAATGTDSLDASGHRRLGVRLESPPGGRAAAATLEAVVSDVNRQGRLVGARALARQYSVTYLARATTPGVFVRPPAHAEEMYNPAVFGRSDGGVFTVRARP